MSYSRLLVTWESTETLRVCFLRAKNNQPAATGLVTGRPAQMVGRSLSMREVLRSNPQTPATPAEYESTVCRYSEECAHRFGLMAQWQRVGLQIKRLGVRLALSSFRPHDVGLGKCGAEACPAPVAMGCIAGGASAESRRRRCRHSLV